MRNKYEFSSTYVDIKNISVYSYLWSVEASLYNVILYLSEKNYSITIKK